MAKALMFLGTSSECGKSIMATAFCRILSRLGVRVAPFKSQNMALNSGVTPDGREMGRAQIAQAEAAGIEPHVDMNPVLLKPTSDKGSQVIVHGVVRGNMEASQYYREKKALWPRVTESYDRLAAKNDVLVLEGAGSPVEINLKEHDIVNMAMAEYADARVVLVADIDRGGVFASLVGTVSLMEPHERRRLVGFIINKFRGDAALLEGGLTFIQEKTGHPVLGVVPYLDGLQVPGEDSVCLDRKQTGCSDDGPVNPASVAIVRLPHISNFTDFEALEWDRRFAVRYIGPGEPFDRFDAVIIPGSKNVLHDLGCLTETGLTERLIAYYRAGGKIAGICGGYQMLGTIIRDPLGVEGVPQEMRALGLLPCESVLEDTKVTERAECPLVLPGCERVLQVQGYEIHMGRTTLCKGAEAVLLEPGGGLTAAGCACRDGRVWGSYLHGLFDNDDFRTVFGGWVRGEALPKELPGCSYRQFREDGYERLAKSVESSVRIGYILKSIGLAQFPPEND